MNTKYVDQADIPDGWMLVPIDPTVHMIRSGQSGGAAMWDMIGPEDVWYRMIESVPPAPEGPATKPEIQWHCPKCGYPMEIDPAAPSNIIGGPRNG